MENRAETARQQAFAPTMLAPTMAMSRIRPSMRPITLDLPPRVLNPEPVSPPSSRASPQSSQPQTGKHAAELTPNAILVQPIANLALPGDLSDSETVITVVPAQRRASVALEDASNPGTSDDATKNRARRSSARWTLPPMGPFALPIDSKLCRNNAYKLIALNGATCTWCNFLFIVIA